MSWDYLNYLLFSLGDGEEDQYITALKYHHIIRDEIYLLSSERKRMTRVIIL